MRIKYICILLLIWSAVSDRMQIHAETSSRIPALEYNLERLYKDYTLLKKVNSRLSADMNFLSAIKSSAS